MINYTIYFLNHNLFLNDVKIDFILISFAKGNTNQFGEILGLNNQINTPPPTNMFFQFQIFLTWQFLLGKKWEKMVPNSRKNVNNKKTCQKIGIENLNFFFCYS